MGASSKRLLFLLPFLGFSLYIFYQDPRARIEFSSLYFYHFTIIGASVCLCYLMHFFLVSDQKKTFAEVFIIAASLLFVMGVIMVPVPILGFILMYAFLKTRTNTLIAITVGFLIGVPLDFIAHLHMVRFNILPSVEYPTLYILWPLIHFPTALYFLLMAITYRIFRPDLFATQERLLKLTDEVSE